MPTKIFLTILYILFFFIFLFSCNDNHAPVIEQFICDSDSVKTGNSANFEVIITDADGDVTHCYWLFDGDRKPEYDRKTKITWIAPNTPGSVMISVEVDDGTDDTSFAKEIIVY